MMDIIKKHKEIKRGRRIIKLASQLNCNAEEFSAACNIAVLENNVLPKLIPTQKDENKFFNNILDWSEKHLGLVEAKLPLVREIRQANFSHYKQSKKKE